MREKKTDKRKVQGAETKKRLYEIAEKMFMEGNFSDVNVEDITDEAGITKGAFYVHFESKDALIAMLIADYAARADTDYRTFLKTLPDDMPSSSVLLALADKISDTLSYTFGCKNMTKIYQMMLAGTTGTDAVKGYGREFYTLVYNILEKGIRCGEFTSSLPLEALSRHFVMAIRGVSYEWCVRHPDFDLREQVTEHIRLLIEGIQTHAPY
jgi:AcrR family transcriptional regulator